MRFEPAMRLVYATSARVATIRAAAGCRLALRVLRALARLVPAVLLALHLARVARDESGLLERGAQLRVGQEERPRDAVPDGDRLRGEPAAEDVDLSAELA